MPKLLIWSENIHRQTKKKKLRERIGGRSRRGNGEEKGVDLLLLHSKPFYEEKGRETVSRRISFIYIFNLLKQHCRI
jgi:hypothetical protein